MHSRHTQIGYLLIVTGGISLLFSLGKPWSFLAVALAVGCFILFPIQTIEIEDKYIVWHFGLGLVRKQVPLAEIKSVAPTKNTWSGRWNIRQMVRFGAFLVCGVDAVELELKSGRIMWLGTDQPEELAKTIEELRLHQIGAQSPANPEIAERRC